MDKVKVGTTGRERRCEAVTADIDVILPVGTSASTYLVSKA